MFLATLVKVYRLEKQKDVSKWLLSDISPFVIQRPTPWHVATVTAKTSAPANRRRTGECRECREKDILQQIKCKGIRLSIAY